MPLEGFKSITVNIGVYEKLRNIAENNHRTIPEQLEHLVEEHLKVAVA